jgi:hypothetical protein
MNGWAVAKRIGGELELGGRGPEGPVRILDLDHLVVRNGQSQFEIEIVADPQVIPC